MSRPHEAHEPPAGHPHRFSHVLLLIVAGGAIATAITVLMDATGTYDAVAWQALIIVFAVLTALAAAYFCLARASEDQE